VKARASAAPMPSVAPGMARHHVDRITPS